MAHGFGAEKSFGLPPFAERFVRRGMAAYVFDYRCFGESEGEPRNLVHPFRHLQDWKAAIDHVRGLPGIDSGRLALWGSSFGGGHVIVTASREPGVAAIVAQVPFVDSLASIRTTGWGHAWRAVRAGFRDLFRALTGRPPYCVPIVGTPDNFALMNTPDALPGVLSLIPEDATWQNACPARIALIMSFYRPRLAAARVRCPALIVMAEKDSLIPAEAVESTARRMPNARLLRMPVGHFDVYTGSGFEEAAEGEASFLAEHLLGDR
jgi:pimeloyl-ACP methyl ester carboxylesterase